MTSAATQRLDRWKRSLLDLSLRNRLLDVRDTKQTVPLALPDVAALAKALEDGAALRLEPFRAPSLEGERAAEAVAKAAEDALADRKLLTTLSADELDHRLVTIARAAAATLADGGVHTLWLGLGLLEWTDEGSDAVRAAPLVLWPVQLARSGAGERYRLTAADDEPRLNETLREKLRVDHHVTWGVARAARPETAPEVAGASADAGTGATDPPTPAAKAPERPAEPAAPAEPDDVDVAAAMAELAAAIAGKPGWRVSASARLGVFSFAKFVMWTDLAERAEVLLDNPLVAHLADGQGQPFPSSGELPEPEAFDREVPVDSLLTPLDADGSQLAAVRAAAAGHTFVLQGPPGTGKSQTITNLVAHCLSEGKSVLFVSEKMAALEVVQRRLTQVGLGDFCLEVHSHKAKRKEVIDQLGRVLERAWRPGAPGAGDDDKLAALRGQLDAYVEALHERGALGLSLHDALARLIELRDAPRLPALAGELAGLDEAGWAKRQGAVEALAAAALALGSLREHPWRGSTLAEWQLSSADKVQGALAEAEAAARALQAAVVALVAAVPGLRAQSSKELGALAQLCEVAARSPGPAAELIESVARRRDEGAAAPTVARRRDEGAAEPAGGARGEIADKIASIKARSRGGDDAEPRAVVPVRRPVTPPTDPQRYVDVARRHRALAAEVEATFSGAIAELEGSEVTALAATFRAWAPRFFLWRFFALRKPRARVRALLASKALPGDEAVASELDKVAGERALRAALEASRADAERWFGVAALPALDLEDADAALAWAHDLAEAFDGCGVDEGATRAGVWRALLAQVASTGDGAPSLELAAFAAVAAAATRWRAAEAALTAETGVTLPESEDGPLGAALDACARWRPEIPALRDHAAYVRTRRDAVSCGVESVAAALEAGELEPSAARGAWERAALLAHCEQRLAASAALKDFHGSTHHANVAEFVELDRATLMLARARAIAKLAERVPKVSADASGEVGTLLHELKKQRRHRPLRDLFRRIPTLLPRLKPCLLMSPLSVAQFLDPSIPRFDLVVFDEASQIPTADAIGALARGERAIIVGDSRQLPPTRFFEVGGDRDEVDSTAAADDDEPYEELESILDESVAARLPQMYLRWHYRSRHEDLIAFSNQHYYDERLYVFPAAAGHQGDLGVSLRKIDGVYDRASTRTNRKEAEAVVAEVIARLRDPAAQRRSIGVVTFSKAQQTLVEDLLDDALRAEPALERFFSDQVPEPVLVKNLESVQGDERDVMLFSIGYGPDASGKVAMNFGPLNRDGGERRLNVAITRAREQLVVFSSLEAAQIRDDVTAAGVRDLGAFLAYAERGGGSARPPAGAAAASPITAAIGAAMEARGHTVAHLVGCAGYRLDLAIVDPDDPARYVLAIETDGTSYASSQVARDRDRLRAQVLAMLGWRTHRIWALDFWADPDKELSRAHAAVIAAVAAARQHKRPISAGANAAAVAEPSAGAARPDTATGAPAAKRAETASGGAPAAKRAETASGATAAPTAAPASASSGPVPTARSGPARAAEASRGSGAAREPSGRAERSGPALKAEALGITPYAVANVPAGRRTADDLFQAKHRVELGKVIEQVVAAEAPMRVELLVRRVAAYFGIARLTAKVIEQVRGQLGERVRWGDEPDVVWGKEQDPKGACPVRAQSAQARRDIDDVPLVELAAAARVVVERSVGIERAELAREVARLLGYGRATERLLARVEEGVTWARDHQVLQIDGERVSLP
ncbi:MAG: DUF3320 domain-containing protein [Kofleriaceae bacterium]